MTNCQACGTETLGQDRFCKNCGAPFAASVEDLADTRRFDPSGPTVNTGSLDPNSPLYAAAPATYPLAQGSTPLRPTQSFIKRLLQRKLLWLLALLLVFLFIGTGVTIGREAVRARRAHRAEQAREAERAKKARQVKQAEVGRRSFEEAVQNAMGFTPATISDVEYPDVQGVFVASLISDDSAAAVARIQAGDLLIELGDQPVRNTAELARVLSSLKPGSEIAVKLYRDEDPVTSRIRIGSSSVAPFLPKTEPRGQGFLGVGDVARRCCIGGTKRWGVEVHRIIDNSPADLAGLQLGDVITEFDKQTIRTPNELARRILAVKPRSKVTIKFYRGNTQQTVDLTAGHGW
jgi:membrane-associated protease RseP (regulator of RpoE activity)